jgi:hypothetical protein
LLQQDVKIRDAFKESLDVISTFDTFRVTNRLQDRLNETIPETVRFFAHRNHVHNYTTYIKNDLARYLIRSFMIFCPDIPMCYDQGKFYQNYSYFTQTGHPYGYREVGLCQACSCTDGCEERGKCCISKYLSEESMLHNESKTGEVKFRSTKQLPRSSCLSTQLGKIIGKDGKHIRVPKQKYFMVAYCPDGYSKGVVWRKCRRFLPPEQRRQEDIYTPVFSFKTNNTYQNKYCAECFGELIDDLFLWRKVIVSGTTNENDRVAVDPFLAAYDEKIVIVFLPPRVLHARFVCQEPRISKCNKTGFWSSYDERLLWACETLPQTVIYLHGAVASSTYKNIYCAMCNWDFPEYTLAVGRWQAPGENRSDINEFDFISHYRQTLGLFAFLLSFSALDVLSAYNIDDKCHPEEVYSPVLVSIIIQIINSKSV